MSESNDIKIEELLKKIKRFKEVNIRLNEITQELGNYSYEFGGVYHTRPHDLQEILNRLINESRLLIANLRGE
jgi:hypothetical protein